MTKAYLSLRQGLTVQVGSLTYKMDVDKAGHELPIQTNDLYIAERNTGPKLLQAKRVVGHGEGPNGHGGWIEPTTCDYSYDLGECVKVVRA